MTNLRAFIAVSLSDEIVRGISRTVEDLKARLPNGAVRWVSAQNLHLTLKFLGDTPATQVDELSQALQAAVAPFPPFELRAAGLGAFPSARRARVVWVGLSAPDTLPALQRAVEYEMARRGFPAEERPFSPHLTIGRVGRDARPADLQLLAAALQNFTVGSLGMVTVEAVHFYKSDLRPAGPVYTRLFSALLSH